MTEKGSSDMESALAGGALAKNPTHSMSEPSPTAIDIGTYVLKITHSIALILVSAFVGLISSQHPGIKPLPSSRGTLGNGSAISMGLKKKHIDDLSDAILALMDPNRSARKKILDRRSVAGSWLCARDRGRSVNIGACGWATWDGPPSRPAAPGCRRRVRSQ